MRAMKQREVNEVADVSNRGIRRRKQQNPGK